jgi:hypothetical protein
MPLDPATAQALAMILGPGLAAAAAELVKIPIKSLTTSAQEKMDELILGEYRLLEEDVALIEAIEKTLDDAGLGKGKAGPQWLQVDGKAIEADSNYEARGKVVLAVAKAASLVTDPTAIPEEVTCLLVVEPEDRPKLADLLHKLGLMLDQLE